MFEQQRWNRIMELLQNHDSLTVDQLVPELDSSPATIRRDIVKMAKAGLIIKKHGSIEPIRIIAEQGSSHFDPYAVTTSDPDFLDVIDQEKEKKIAIAKKAASLVNDGDVIFIGTGSSTYYMLDHIHAKDIIIITTSLIHLKKIISLGFQAYLPEGEVNLDHDFIVPNDDAIERLSSYNISKTFLGSRGINIENGLSTSSFIVYKTKRKLIDLPITHYVLADSSKFGSKYMITFASPEEVTLITDRIEQDYAKAYKHILAD
ncbi:MAG: DeoR/GlpR transcriptional regulator [Erysipelotrichaceae bacterium]|nr:DeoR/GlpR transcriptional regulator [Erysipelotrichaceae bacterium]